MNDMKLELLRKVFWDMNSISYRVERRTNGSGKDKTTVVYLYITIGTGDGEIVTIALSQLGNVGGQPLLELVRLPIACGMVCLLCQLVCK